MRAASCWTCSSLTFVIGQDHVPGTPPSGAKILYLGKPRLPTKCKGARQLHPIHALLHRTLSFDPEPTLYYTPHLEGPASHLQLTLHPWPRVNWWEGGEVSSPWTRSWHPTPAALGLGIGPQDEAPDSRLCVSGWLFTRVCMRLLQACDPIRSGTKNPDRPVTWCSFP